MVLAQQPVRDHDIVAEDYFSIGVINGANLSPDGRLAAYAEMRWEPPAERRNTDLWIVDVKTKELRRLTFDRANESVPQWSLDGKFLYYTAGYKRAGEDKPPYDGKNQVWRISADGGEPLAVTRINDGVGLFDLARDGKSVYYTVTSEQTEDEWKDMRGSYKELQYGHGVTKFGQVWRLDLSSWRTEKLVDDKRVINALKVSPDGRRIATLTTPDEELIHMEGFSRVDVYDTQTKKVQSVTKEDWRKEHPSPYGWLNELSWSGDGLALAFSIAFDGHPVRLYVAEWLGEEPQVTELSAPKGVSVHAGTLQWRGKTRDLCLTGEERARARVYALTNVRNGKAAADSVLTSGEVTVDSFSFSESGEALAVVTSTPTDPPDVYTVGKDGGLDRLTKVNPQVDQWKLPQIQLVQWTAPDGQEVESILELPFDHKPGDKPLPMVVEIHGGPTSAVLYQLQFWIYGRTLMPAKGYALLSPNYRGSTGYGDKFLTDLVGQENDVEVKDILAGVDAMVQRGIADPDRLGVMGWSNGGFLTNCLITQTDRFKAASSGAGVIDQVIQWGTEDTPGHVINFMAGGQPWSKIEEFRSASPLYNLDKVKTPTLIHVGEKDERVPAAHARTLFRGLRQYLNVPAELIVYPGEGHGLTVYKHRKAKMEWDLAWFDRYIMKKPTEAPPNPTEKPASQ